MKATTHIAVVLILCLPLPVLKFHDLHHKSIADFIWRKYEMKDNDIKNVYFKHKIEQSSIDSNTAVSSEVLYTTEGDSITINTRVIGYNSDTIITKIFVNNLEYKLDAVSTEKLIEKYPFDDQPTSNDLDLSYDTYRVWFLDTPKYNKIVFMGRCRDCMGSFAASVSYFILDINTKTYFYFNSEDESISNIFNDINHDGYIDFFAVSRLENSTASNKYFYNTEAWTLKDTSIEVLYDNKNKPFKIKYSCESLTVCENPKVIEYSTIK